MTKITYDLPNDKWVKIAIYDIKGRKIRSLVNQNQNLGCYEIRWDGRNDFGKKLSSYVKIFEDNGMTLGYHNHAFEFNMLPSGKMPIECILEHNEKLKYEIDIGWVVAGKADPIFWIKKFASRIIACHLKDFSSPDNNLIDHDSQCAIGNGFIDWKSILYEI